MKKIGILFGQENNFPQALVDHINSKNESGISAELVKVDKLVQSQAMGYDVVLDRISHDVPFYRAMLKNAALTGTAVANNPFYLSLEEKFMANVIAEKVGVPVPKTVLIPSNQLPPDTTENSFRNMIMPWDWKSIFEYVGFPAYMKPHAGGGWKSVSKLNNADEFFGAHQTTGQLVMLLQEAIEFDAYFRCYCIGQNQIHIMPYEPRNAHHLRYSAEFPHIGNELLELMKEYVLRLNIALGYDFNTIEFAIRNGVPYCIDFTNPTPDCEPASVGQQNFEWVREAAANMLIRKAKQHREGQDNLTWGTFLKSAVNGEIISSREFERLTV
jgi:hypothetical protein